MEGLRKQSLSAFSEANFIPVPAEHELITLKSSTSTHLDRVSLPLADILQSFEQESTPQPTLRLVKLHIIHPPVGRTWEAPTLNASGDDIIALWHMFKLDLSFLNLIAKGIRGSYQYHPASWDPLATSSFMVSSFTHCIAWTYSPQSQTTCGVVIIRPDVLRGQNDAEYWIQALDMQLAVVKHPLCLFLAYAMQTMDQTYQGSLICQAQINHIEKITGYNPWSRDSDGDPTPITLDELSLASRNIGAVSVSLADYLRQIQLLQQATEALGSSGFTEDSSSVPESANVAAALHVLLQQVNSWEVRIEYLRERAKNQLTVVR
jgi:hypothetical protein